MREIAEKWREIGKVSFRMANGDETSPTVPLNLVPLEMRIKLATMTGLEHFFEADEEVRTAIEVQKEAEREKAEQERLEKEEIERRKQEETERVARGEHVMTPTQLLEVMEQLYNKKQSEQGPTPLSDVDEQEENLTPEERERERKTISKISIWTGGKFEGTLEMEPRKLLMMWEEWGKRFLITCKSKDIKSKEGKLVTLQSVANDLISRLLDTQGIIEHVKTGSFEKTWRSLNKYFKGLGSSVDAVTEFRSMRMDEKENFSAWFLKLNQQLLLCDIPLDKHPYELKHTILTGAVLEIKLKLMEAGGEKLSLNEIKEKAVTFDRLRREKAAKESEKVEELFTVTRKRSRSSERSYGRNRYGDDRGYGSKFRRTESSSRSERREDGVSRYGQKYGSGWKKSGFEGTCNKCQRYGHKAVDCMKDKCYNCGVQGHIAARCQVGMGKKRYREERSGDNVSKDE